MYASGGSPSMGCTAGLNPLDTKERARLRQRKRKAAEDTNRSVWSNRDRRCTLHRTEVPIRLSPAEMQGLSAPVVPADSGLHLALRRLALHGTELSQRIGPGGYDLEAPDLPDWRA